MSDDMKVFIDDVSVKQEPVVIVDNNIDTKVSWKEPIVQLYPEEFVISSGGIYGGNGLTGAIPSWILKAIEQELTTGSGSVMSVLIGIQTALDTLQTGVTQSISSLNTLTSQQSGLLTGLRSDVNMNNASILNTLATKVDATQANSAALSAIQSKFGSDVSSFIGNIASTYVDANSAIAQDIQMLTASVNDVSGSITDVSLLTIETVSNPLWADDGHLTDPDISGEPRYITRAKATKQLQVDANGVISGILLESGATSSVTIQGDQFKLVASGQSVASRNPFTVNAVTGEIVFNGKMSFNSVTDVPELGSTPQQVVDAVNEGNTTTINGGKITATSLLVDNINAVSGVIASYLQAGIVSIGNTISSNDFLSVGGGGFRLKSNAAGTEFDPTIYGAYIKGGVIDSASMNVRKLNVLNDAGFLVKSFYSFYANTNIPVGTSNVNGIIELEIYPYNSSKSTAKKLAGTTNVYISFDNIGTVSLLLGTDIYFQIVGYTGSTTSGTAGSVKLKCGSSTLSESPILGTDTNLYFELNGIGFYYNGYLYIRKDNYNVSISDTSQNNIVIMLPTFVGGASGYYSWALADTHLTGSAGFVQNLN
jgi:hypothetical protein